MLPPNDSARKFIWHTLLPNAAQHNASSFAVYPTGSNGTYRNVVRRVAVKRHSSQRCTVCCCQTAPNHNVARCVAVHGMQSQRCTVRRCLTAPMATLHAVSLWRLQAPYNVGLRGVATSATPTGPFRWDHAENPNGLFSMDMTE
jgi:hypothetical protein